MKNIYRCLYHLGEKKDVFIKYIVEDNDVSDIIADEDINYQDWHFKKNQYINIDGDNSMIGSEDIFIDEKEKIIDNKELYKEIKAELLRTININKVFINSYKKTIKIIPRKKFFKEKEEEPLFYYKDDNGIINIFGKKFVISRCKYSGKIIKKIKLKEI